MTKTLEAIRQMFGLKKPPFVRTETEAEFNARKQRLADEFRRLAAEQNQCGK